MRAFVTSFAFVLGALGLGALLTGCATAYSRGAEAFHAGRYADAAREFGVAAETGTSIRRLDALSGLGISRYKLGDFPGARAVLQRVLTEEPRRGEARLYLALVELGSHEEARAVEELQVLRPLIHHPRIAATVERAIVAIRGGLSESARGLVAASLDDAVEWARDVREASQHTPVYLLEPSWTLYRDRYYPRLP
jgi:tetratricopeptide (TPR) repeat protein